MIKEEAQRLSQQLNMSPEQVVREEWEIKILKTIFDSSIGQKLYFKGGTALRLAYASPRFSEDLDFTIIKKITLNEFKKICQDFSQRFPQVKISDLAEKFNTLLAEFKISEFFLTQNISLKIEISKRSNKKYKKELLLLSSPITNLQVLGYTEIIADIYQEKIAALSSRAKARDLFDIWFICQKLKQPLPPKLARLDKKIIKSELRRFLPSNYNNLINDLIKKYGK